MKTIKVFRGIELNLYPTNLRIFVEFAWNSGEPFRLFQLSICEVWDDYNVEKDGGITIFGITIAKLMFSIGVQRDA